MRWAVWLLLVAGVSCGDPAVSDPMRAASPPGMMPPEHSAMPAPAAVVVGARRLSLEQIERSLETIANLPEGAIRFPQTLAHALGRPDYKRSTAPSLDASPLFAKFMTDLAGITCRDLIRSDPERPPALRVLTRFSDADENLRYLILRFLGLSGAAQDAYVRRLQRVRSLATMSEGRADAGWYAVCIALTTSPEFLIY